MLKKTLLLTFGLLIIFLSSTLTRIDRTPYKALDFYKKSIYEINQLLTKNPSRSIGDTSVSYTHLTLPTTPYV